MDLFRSESRLALLSSSCRVLIMVLSFSNLLVVYEDRAWTSDHAGGCVLEASALGL